MLTRARRLVLVLSLIPAAVAAAERPGPTLGLRDDSEAAVAFVDARIVVAPGRVIETGTLVLREGRVAAVGSDISVPAGATTVDASGRTIYPGFIDPLTEYGLAKTGPVNGEKENPGPHYEGRELGGRSWNDAMHAEIRWADRFEPDIEAAKKLLSRGVTVVHSAKQDGIFRGRGFVVSLAAGEPSELILEPDALHVMSFDKGSSKQAYPSSLMGSIALIRQTFLDASWYAAARSAHQADTSQPAPDFSSALDALSRYDGPYIFESGDELSLLRAARIGRELDKPLIHVGSGLEWQRIDEIAALGRPLILPLRFPTRPAVDSFDDQLDVSLADLRHWERAPSTAALLAERGVPLAFTGARLDDKENLLANVRRAIRRGLGRDAALAALTTVPARLLGVADRVGTLEPGRRADFIVSDGDLFGEGARILAVWVDGEPALEVVALDATDFRGSWSLTLEGVEYSLELGRADTGQRQDSPGEAQDRARRSERPRAAPDAPLRTETGGAAGERRNDRDTAVRLRGRLVRGEASVELDRVESARHRLSFSADLGKLGAHGIARFVLRAVEDRTEADVALPDGRLVRAEARRRGDEAAPRTDAEPPAFAELDDGPLVSRVTYPNSAFGFETLPAAEDVLVRGATIWTGESEGMLENADLLVRGGRIAAVGAGLDVPRGVRVIDAGGKHVTAGLIDEHSHLAISRGVNEGSHAVTSEVRIGDVVNPDDVGIYRALAGGVTTAQLLHGSANPIGGQAQVIKLRWGRSAEELKLDAAPPTIKFALGENVKQSNWGDRFRGRYPQTRMGVETLMRDAFLAAREYERRHAHYRALSARERSRTIPPRRDLTLEALAEILASERFIHCHSYQQSEILMLMRLAEELGFRVQTFTHILEGYKVAPEMAAHGATASAFSDWWAYKFEVYDAIPHNTCLMHDAGVVTSINSDSAEMIRRLNQEAAKSVMYCGMDRHEALKLATLNPAIQLRIDDRVGSLAAGKDADFVIWSGDPLSVYSRVEQTWIEGALHFSRERDAGLRKSDREEKLALIQRALAAGGKSADRGTGNDAAKAQPEWHCEDVSDVWSR